MANMEKTHLLGLFILIIVLVFLFTNFISAPPAKTTTPVCGNGIREGTEQCDDKNTRNGDGCSSTCRNETPVKVPLPMPTPLPPPAAVCGNGVVEAGEACDDGNTDNSDVCTTTCQVSSCRDTDPTNDINVGGTVTTSNGTYNDFCSSVGGSCSGTDPGDPSSCYYSSASSLGQYNCNFAGATILNRTTCPSGYSTFGPRCTYLNLSVLSARCIPTPVCGDGILETGEVCDDGNTVNGDACSSNCRCSDSDGGNNLTVGGSVTTIYDGISNDSCQTYNTNIINESICTSYSTYSSVNSTCPSGYVTQGPGCSISGTGPARCVPSLCIDSDSSDPFGSSLDTSYSTPGSVNASGATYSDYCDPSGTDVFETFCEGATHTEIDFSCVALGTGYRCLNSTSGIGYCGRG